MNTRTAVILAGGKGTRLRSLYNDRPKALVPVGGKPFIEWQVDWLLKSGIDHIIISAGYRADQLYHWAADTDIDVVEENRPLGTGGAVRFATDAFDDDHFFVLNGDSLCPAVNFQTLESVFQGLENANKRLGVLAVAPIEDTGRYGTVEFDTTGRITAFREKEQRESGFINAGVYRLSRQVLEEVPADEMVSLETDVFPRLVERGALAAVPFDPPLLDMGTPEGLRRMEEYLQRSD